MRRPALQYKQAGVLRMAFRAQKAFGTFEKRLPRRHILKKTRTFAYKLKFLLIWLANMAFFSLLFFHIQGR